MNNKVSVSNIYPLSVTKFANQLRFLSLPNIIGSDLLVHSRFSLVTFSSQFFKYIQRQTSQNFWFGYLLYSAQLRVVQYCKGYLFTLGTEHKSTVLWLWGIEEENKSKIKDAVFWLGRGRIPRCVLIHIQFPFSAYNTDTHWCRALRCTNDVLEV